MLPALRETAGVETGQGPSRYRWLGPTQTATAKENDPRWQPRVVVKQVTKE